MQTLQLCLDKGAGRPPRKRRSFRQRPQQRERLCMPRTAERLQPTQNGCGRAQAGTGMRRAEVASLKWDDGDTLASVLRFEQQTIRVIGKGRKPRLVPVHPILGEVLTERPGSPGDFVVPSGGKNGVAMKTIMEMTKRMSPIYTPHDYRRTVATNLRRNGVDSGVIDRIMGWAPSSIFRRYYDNVADQELHRAILQLYRDDPI